MASGHVVPNKDWHIIEFKCSAKTGQFVLHPFWYRLKGEMTNIECKIIHCYGIYEYILLPLWPSVMMIHEKCMYCFII